MAEVASDMCGAPKALRVLRFEFDAPPLDVRVLRAGGVCFWFRKG